MELNNYSKYSTFGDDFIFNFKDDGGDELQEEPYIGDEPQEHPHIGDDKVNSKLEPFDEKFFMATCVKYIVGIYEFVGLYALNGSTIKSKLGKLPYKYISALDDDEFYDLVFNIQDLSNKSIKQTHFSSNFAENIVIPYVFYTLKIDNKVVVDNDIFDLGFLECIKTLEKELKSKCKKCNSYLLGLEADDSVFCSNCLA